MGAYIETASVGAYIETASRRSGAYIETTSRAYIETAFFGGGRSHSRQMSPNRQPLPENLGQIGFCFNSPGARLASCVSSICMSCI